MADLSFIQKIKKYVKSYVYPPEWPWEIISGLLITLILINNIKNILGDRAASEIIPFSIIIIAITLFWGVFDGLMFIYTHVLERGRYNRMISLIKSQDKNVSFKQLNNELNQTVISLLDKRTRYNLTKRIWMSISSLPQHALKKPRISKSDIIGAFFYILLVILPCIVILVPFLLINNLNLAIFASNIVGLTILFFLGYRLGSCIDRNKILSGLATMLLGLIIMLIGKIIGA